MRVHPAKMHPAEIKERTKRQTGSSISNKTYRENNLELI